MQITRVHFTLSILIKMLGMNMQERIKLAYTAALAQVPRLLTWIEEIEKCHHNKNPAMNQLQVKQICQLLNFIKAEIITCLQIRTRSKYIFQF